MKNIITAVLVLVSASVFGASWSVSSETIRNGANGYVRYGGTAAGDTGSTNAAYAAIMPAGARTPVLNKLIAGTDCVYSNANPFRAFGSLNVYVPTNIAIIVGAAVYATAPTNYVISNTTLFTNDYGNAIPSNTVFLCRSKASGKMAMNEAACTWATAAADPMTNLVFRWALTLSPGDEVWPMHRVATFNPAALNVMTNLSPMYVMDQSSMGLVGAPGMPMLIECTSLYASNAFVYASGVFE